ncbi:hypothetical protein VTN77DRAFT_6034 [Rasamsonia byssochlamydoides]|uniref:uncharacterized protein n=1 Tax=Rasamsonia byssochlamydoides TaxID=89139 RepID=UPI0037445915
MAKETSSQSVEELNACVSTPSGHRPARNETTFREWLVANQIGISLTILSTLLAVHNLYPSLRAYTTPFFEMSYYQPTTGLYIHGRDDIYFVISAILAFTAVRAIFIDWIFRPWAKRAGLKRKASVRFAEQAWLLVYYGSFWTFGMYLWTNSNYWDSFKAIWSDWPAREMTPQMKWYLLMQLSFWIQQIFIVNIEERRKDHYQMLTHHLITSTLLGSAYIYRFYNVSNVVLCLMDIVDFLLPAAKILKYFGYEMCCNVAFGVFLLTWFVARHVMYLSLCWSIYKDVPAQMAYGCYSGTTAEMLTTDGYPDRWRHLFSPYFDLDGPICMNRGIKWIFLSFLLALQVLSLIWFGMIIRVAIGVIRSGNAEDTRSDDEDEDEVETEEVAGVVVSKETVVADSTSSEAAWRRSNGSVRTRRGGVLRDQSDRKALLGRIGCDKPTT